MGHDISAYLKSKETEDGGGDEIAYNRRSAFNELNIELYNALECADGNYCGCSGCGGEQEFSLEQIKSALEKIKGRDDLEQERKFLQDCINADDGGGFVIHFY